MNKTGTSKVDARLQVKKPKISEIFRVAFGKLSVIKIFKGATCDLEKRFPVNEHKHQIDKNSD